MALNSGNWSILKEKNKRKATEKRLKRLKCKREPTNKEDKNTVSSYQNVHWEKNLSSGIFQKTCKNVSMFLTLPHCSMGAEVVVKKLNRGCGYGLEIPVRYQKTG